MLGVTKAGAGRLAVFGDSNCLDSNQHASAHCFDMLLSLARHVTEGDDVSDIVPDDGLLSGAGLEPSRPLPQRRTDYNFAAVSKVLGFQSNVPTVRVFRFSQVLQRTPVCTRGMGQRAVGPAEAGKHSAVGRIGALEGVLHGNLSANDTAAGEVPARSWRPGEQGYVDAVPQFWTEGAQGQVRVGRR